jgi:uncharacterized protein
VRQAFADTSYWVALFDLTDPFHDAAEAAARDLAGCPLVTTEMVLGEFLSFMSRQRPLVRKRAAQFVRRIVQSPDLACPSSDRPLFLAAVSLYERRADKTYSLTDCISMLVMRERRLRDVLTTDRHFEQEGFRIILPTA